MLPTTDWYLPRWFADWWLWNICRLYDEKFLPRTTKLLMIIMMVMMKNLTTFDENNHTELSLQVFRMNFFRFVLIRFNFYPNRSEWMEIALCRRKKCHFQKNFSEISPKKKNGIQNRTEQRSINDNCFFFLILNNK